jgi:hypothetical protein
VSGPNSGTGWEAGINPHKNFIVRNWKCGFCTILSHSSHALAMPFGDIPATLKQEMVNATTKAQSAVRAQPAAGGIDRRAGSPGCQQQ